MYANQGLGRGVKVSDPEILLPPVQRVLHGNFQQTLASSKTDCMRWIKYTADSFEAKIGAQFNGLESSVPLIGGNLSFNIGHESYRSLIGNIYSKEVG